MGCHFQAGFIQGEKKPNPKISRDLGRVKATVQRAMFVFTGSVD